jgi:hypothetical protein
MVVERRAAEDRVAEAHAAAARELTIATGGSQGDDGGG